MCIICDGVIADCFRTSVPSLSLYVAGEHPVENYRKEDCIDDMHLLKKTKQTMDVFVYGGCYTNGTSNFRFAGLDLPTMLVNYQRKKEDDFKAEQDAASIHDSVDIRRFGEPTEPPTSPAPSTHSKRKPSTNPERIERKRQRAEGREKQRLQDHACQDAVGKQVLEDPIRLHPKRPSSNPERIERKRQRAEQRELLRLEQARVEGQTMQYVQQPCASLCMVSAAPSRGAVCGGTGAGAVHLDSYYVVLTKRICGFKYASSTAVALRDIGPFNIGDYVFKAGDHVFVKIGEVLANNLQSQSINIVMKDIGMPYVEEVILPVVFDTEAWTEHSLQVVSENTTRWGPAMLNMMEGVVARHQRLRLNVNMKVSTLFHGVRLGWLDRNEEVWCRRILEDESCKQMLGKTLCMLLFVVVYFGVTDSGPFNCMVDADGRVLLVDISTADSARMIKFHGLGLFPSGHKYAVTHIQQVVRYVRNNRAELADFLVRLKASAPPNPNLVLDEQCPFFDDVNLEALRSDDASEPYFLYLIAEISRNPCSKKEVAMPFHTRQGLVEYANPT